MELVEGGKVGFAVFERLAEVWDEIWGFWFG
jgi:hypothetical protein